MTWLSWLLRRQKPGDPEGHTDPVLVDARVRLVKLQQRAGIDDSEELDVRRVSQEHAMYHSKGRE